MSEEQSSEKEVMGLAVHSEFVDQLTKEIDDAVKEGNIKRDQMNAIKRIILYKAADWAILNRKEDIASEEIEGLKRTCWDFIRICMRSTVLDNSNITACVLTSWDTQMLNDIGITKNSQLANASAEKIVSMFESHFPKFKIDRNFFKRRAEIWKEEAKVLNQIQQNIK
jgi:hypothetical protein